MNDALGLIEVAGLGCGVNTSDIMVKTANVKLVGIERAKGSGWLTVKIVGDVGAVTAAIDAAKQSAEQEGKFVASKIIPRPGDGLEMWLKPGLDAEIDQTIEEDKHDTFSELSESSHNEVTEEIITDNELEVVNDDELTISVTEEPIESSDSQNLHHVTCNLCKDVLCQRKKGEPRKECLHYDTLKLEN